MYSGHLLGFQRFMSGQINCFRPFRAETVFRRQNLTSKDVSQTLTSKYGPRTEKIKTIIMAVDPYTIGIQMKRKELTKSFMMI